MTKQDQDRLVQAAREQLVIRAAAARAIRKATLAPLVDEEHIERMLDAYIALKDKEFAVVVEVLKSTNDTRSQQNETPLSESPADLTYELLKAKYGGKQ
jgi:DNA mismatch repair ATPase MutS